MRLVVRYTRLSIISDCINELATLHGSRSLCAHIQYTLQPGGDEYRFVYLKAFSGQ